MLATLNNNRQARWCFTHWIIVREMEVPTKPELDVWVALN